MTLHVLLSARTLSSSLSFGSALGEVGASKRSQPSSARSAPCHVESEVLPEDRLPRLHVLLEPALLRGAQRSSLQAAIPWKRPRNQDTGLVVPGLPLVCLCPSDLTKYSLRSQNSSTEMIFSGSSASSF